MRVLITGINGLLGSNIARIFQERGHTVFGSGRQSKASVGAAGYFAGDLLQSEVVSDLFEKTSPDAVIHCVGLADVNRCESDPGLADALNVQTAAGIAQEAARCQCRLLHVSTDHLFDGTRPLRTEAEPPTPLNEYARSKWRGEQAVVAAHPAAAVIRTSFYGWSPVGHAPTFAEWMHDSLAAQKAITLYTDLYFNAIEVSALALALEEVLAADFSGVLNIASSERASKYDFGRVMAEVFGFSLQHVTATTFKEDSLQVRRPHDLSLATTLFRQRFKSPLPTLKEGLMRLHAQRALHVAGR